MRTKRHRKTTSSHQEAGVALITVLLLMFLMSSLLVGFCILLISNQQLAGSNNADVSAFYGAEAGMEQLTANLGNLFAQTYSPTMSQINAVATSPAAPVIPGISFVNGSGASGYTISLNPATTTYDSNGNPIPNTSAVKIGPYAGLTAFTLDYILTVHARTTAGREVELTRTTQTVGIPAYSFGVFCGIDCSFFAGPTFTFGGRTHSNGNLFLASQSTLTLADKTDAYGDIIRTELSNGFHNAGTYDGTVNVTTKPAGTSCPNCRALAMSEGSWDPVTATADANWPTISTGPSPTDYNHNLINGLGSLAPTLSTGAKQLNLAVAILGNGATQTVDLNRRPALGEARTITSERYFDQASLRILLSDNAADITSLPCVTAGAPLDLSTMANPLKPVANWTASGAPLSTIFANVAKNTTGAGALPLAASGAAGVTGGLYTATDGYWVPNGYPVIHGFIKIEEQTSYGNATSCGTWVDVTTEILGYGYVGRNIDPVPQSWNGSTLNPQWPGTTASMAPSEPPATWPTPSLPAAQVGTQSMQNGSAAVPLWAGGATLLSAASTPTSPHICPDPHPNAIIRLERVRDNPSSNTAFATGQLNVPVGNLPKQATAAQVCGVDPATGKLAGGWTPQFQDFWPNVLFDTREGELREASMSAANNWPTLNGAMSYIEIDGKNLANWFAGTLGGNATTGPNTKDPNNSSNNFVVYISDRRGNYADSTVQAITIWPPLSSSGNETGEYGWTDNINPGNAAAGCPNDALDTGEDENLGTTDAGLFYFYGASQKYIHAKGASLASLTTNPGTLGVFSVLSGTALTTNDNCAAVPAYSTTDNIWPMMVATNPNAPRENPPLFFRRAIKIINGNNLTALGKCPSGDNCGLTIATENPVYIQGDFNANSANGGIGDPYVPSSVSSDAVTLLSNYWNDVNSFSTPYCGDQSQCTSNRGGITTNYRMAVLAGVSGTFPLPGGATSATVPQDFGTNGGVHNFLRFLEDWGVVWPGSTSGQTLNYRGSIVQMFYSRQANGTFKCCKTVYSPPSRGYNFDTDFSDPSLLPPRTPLFRDVNTTGWTRVMLPSQ
jgi:hypothetical protein